MNSRVRALLLVMFMVAVACAAPASPTVTFSSTGSPPPAGTSPASGNPPPASGPSATATSMPTRASPPAPTPTGPSARNVVRIEAPSLANNLVGEPTAREVVVYLPPAYFTTQRRFPVVYYLAGYDDRGMTGFTLPKDLDQLIADDKVHDTIVVVADGISRAGGSFYVNSSATGNWEDYITTDLVSYVDGHFRTLARATARGITGHSMGGFGALSIAVHHPEVFGAVYAMSPGLFDENGLRESQMFDSDSDVDSFLELQSLLTGLTTADALGRTPGYEDFTVSYGLAFAPNAKRQPLPFDYPFSLVAGKAVRDDAIWLTWQRGFGGLAETARRDRSSWMKLKGVAIDYGVDDEYPWIPKGCVHLAEQLKAAGIAVTIESFSGAHQDKLGERIGDHMFPFFSATLESE
jgi:S-formylglutathione hydrolase